MALPTETIPAEPQVRPGRPRHRRPLGRGRAIAIAIMVLAAAIGGAAVGGRLWAGSAKPSTHPSPSLSPSRAPSGPVTATQAAQGPVSGPGTFTYATSTGPVHGTAGTLKRFRVGVENGIGQDLAAFVGVVDKTFGDPRGWTAGGQLRLQRVSGQATADFTVLLATPATSEAMCATAGLHTNQYVSCRTPGKLIINLARWLAGAPDYGAPIEAYREYAINHELGHELGYGHEGCPGAGDPAPVMMQQTLGLKGCVANAWPFVDGDRYSGPKVP
jgi:hypothetical protein